MTTTFIDTHAHLDGEEFQNDLPEVIARAKAAHYEDILRNYEIIIYPRLNAPIDKQSLPHNVHLLDTPLYNISSTEVRRRIKQGADVSQLIPTEIIPLATRYYPHP